MRIEFSGRENPSEVLIKEKRSVQLVRSKLTRKQGRRRLEGKNKTSNIFIRLVGAFLLIVHSAWLTMNAHVTDFGGAQQELFAYFLSLSLTHSRSANNTSHLSRE